MKKIGVTYFLGLEKIIPKINDLVDTIEIVNLSHLKKVEALDWTYHFRIKDPYNSRSGSLNLLKFSEIKEALTKSKKVIFRKKPKIISVHLGFSAMERGKAPPDDHDIALSKVLSRKKIMKRFAKSLDYLTEFTENLGIPLAVENLDYHQGGAYEYVCEPEFIQEIFQRNKKIWFLLDITHAEISAVELTEKQSKNRLKITREYLKSLPLERTIEIHINSPNRVGKSLWDMHSPIGKTEKRLLRKLLTLQNLEVINLECESKVERQLKYLRREMKIAH